MKKTILLAFIALALSSCQGPTSSSSGQSKIPLAYVENGGLEEISGVDLYQKVITEQQNVPFLVTIPGCQACATAKADLDALAVSLHFIVYYITLDGSAEDYATTYDYLYRATNEAAEYGDQAGWPEIGEDYSVPCLYVMYESWIGLCVFESFTTNLVQYTEVVQ